LYTANVHYRCSCLEGFDGPRCQQTHISFNGKGWAWYPPLGQCHQGHTRSETKVRSVLQGHTSLEIITSRDSGLILYFGPLTNSRNNNGEDFLLLEMRGGYPVLRVNQGSGEARLAARRLPSIEGKPGIWRSKTGCVETTQC